MTDKYSYTTQRKFRNVYCICPSYGYLERKDVSQQRSLTANKFHSKEVSPQRSLTAKKPHSKSQQRSLTAKKCRSKEVSHESFVFRSFSCSFWGKPRTKASLSQVAVASFEGSGFTTSMYTIYLRLGCRDQDRRSFFLANVILCFFVTVLANRVGLLLCVVVAQVVLWPLWSLAACCLQIAYWNCRAKGPEMSWGFLTGEEMRRAGAEKSWGEMRRAGAETSWGE